MPAVDSPDPGGLDWAELERLLGGLLRHPGLVGVNIGIYDPDLDPDRRYARLVTDLLRRCLQSLVTPPVESGAMLQALHAPGPRLPADEESHLYAPLIGSWDAEVVDYPDDGEPIRSRGEWHFAWVLEGRAVQDVWISPPRGERSPVRPGPNRYGTTVRVYDPPTGTWSVTWFNPVTQSFDRLVGRKIGPDIVQERRSEGRIEQWIFTEITPDSARWIGRTSRDGGDTWRIEAEFHLRRRP